MSHRIALAIIAISAVLNGGCKSLLGQTGDKDSGPKPTGDITPRTAKDLVDYLNRQAGAVQSISYSDVSVHSSENGHDLPRLGNSTLVAQQPRNFRLNCATGVTSNEVDLGSNDREFWMYVKRLDGPNYFYCSHDEFARGAGKKFPIPFDTDWVMQALGMAVFPTDGQYDVRISTQSRKYVLEQKTVTSAGVPVLKQVAFNVDHDQGRKPVVWKHRIADEKNQTLATAEIMRVKTLSVRDPQTQKAVYVQVPAEVVLEWPLQKFRMRLVLDGEKVNEDLRDRQAALFTRPQIRGTNPIDLATYTFDPTARGQAPDRRR